jgi:hypothetical protein
MSRGKSRGRGEIVEDATEQENISRGKKRNDKKKKNPFAVSSM